MDNIKTNKGNKMKYHEEQDSDIIGSLAIDLEKLGFYIEEEGTSLTVSKGLMYECFSPECGDECIASKGANITANNGEISVELTKGSDIPDIVEETLKFTDEDEAINAIRNWVYEGEDDYYSDIEMEFLGGKI